MRIAYTLSSELPAGYSRLEYLQSSGTQYIDLNYAFNIPSDADDRTFEVRFDIQKTITQTDMQLWGCRSTSSTNACRFNLNNVKLQTTTLTGIDKFPDITVPSPDTTTRLVFNYKSNPNVADTCTLNEQSGSYPYTVRTAYKTGNIALFGIFNSSGVIETGNTFVGKMYGFKLTVQSKEVRNLVPAKRNSDNTIGMYDLVGKKFYTNSGTGTFTAGSVIEEVEYIQSSGTQHIQTDVIGTRTSGLKVYVDCEGTGEGGSSAQVVVSGDGHASAGQWFGGNSKNGFYSSGGAAISNVSYKTRVQTTISFGTEVSWELNGTTYSRGGNISGSDPVYLFEATLHGTKYSSYSKIYACKIYNEGELKSDLVPVKVGTEYAMFDKVNGVVYRNQGTGSFTGGNVVKHYTPRLVYTVKKALVPNEYEQLEYLESTGTQWIHTDYTPNNATVFEMDCQFLNTSSGRNGLYSDTSRYYFGTVSGQWAAGIAGQGFNHTLGVSDTNRHLFKIDNRVFYVDGVSLYDMSGTTATYGNTITLFAEHERDNAISNPAKERIYSSKISDNSGLIHNFIPAKRLSDNKLGMYDTVNGVFYTNAGTGSFTGGSVVSNYQLRFIRTPVIPFAYTRVEYLETITNTYSAGAYIDTGFKPKNNTKVECVAEWNTTTAATTEGNPTLYGCRPDNSKRYEVLSDRGYSKIYYQYGSKEPSIAFNDFGVKHKFTTDSNKLYIDDELKITATESTFTITQNLTLFCLNKVGDKDRFVNAKVYIFKIWDNGTLVRNLIPCIRNSDNVAGMYDKVTGNFYTNAGTGTFTTGPIIAD